jgi:hypothetical protein
MKTKSKTIYYYSLLLFLIGCIATKALIANVTDSRNTTDSWYLPTAIVIFVTFGLGLLSFFGLTKKSGTIKLPKTVHRIGQISLILGTAMILLAIAFWLWIAYGPNDWGY